MTASASDKFKKVAPNTGWQLDASGISDASVDTFGLVSATNIPTGTGVKITIDRVDSSGASTPAKMERIDGEISENNVINCVRGVEGTAQAHAGGAVVEIVISADLWNDTMDGMLVGHNQDGSHKVIPLNAPEGFLINGKIVPSVASNNLTVALKTKAGEDPSADDPVYVMIGGTLRIITSALSVTKNAGTNWFNSGSTELATHERDFFSYLGYNATDGVVIGYSPYPGASEYDDFSTTTTNEKYCAISTITNAAAGDDYIVIGRFAATLSAGAGYTWTVPTFTNKNLIQRPIYDNRVTTPSCPAPQTRLNSKIIALTRDLTLAGGDVSYAGVGFTPSALFAIGSLPGAFPFSVGIADSAKGNASLLYYQGDTGQVTGTDIMKIQTAAGVGQRATLKSYDADGFTVTWAKDGSPTGVASFYVLCIR